MAQNRVVGDSAIDAAIENWFKWDKNEKTRQQIDELIARKDIDGLRSRMIGRLAFGTAGIRARMDAGFNRLNDLTIIQITQGMIAHMKAEFASQENRAIVIGFDGRYNSKRFAELAANAFMLNGISVHLFTNVTPTPIVSYATVDLHCLAGLMITASHNPKEDNGYKAYWSNGAQIIEPHDRLICQLAYEHHAEPNVNIWNIDNVHDHKLFLNADSAIEHYFADAKKFNYYHKLNAESTIKFAYSAFHGVGLEFTPRCLREFGFHPDHIIIVSEQALPDPDFPTVPFPNPEEGRAVLELSIATADREGCTLILANDPDADRLQLAEKQKNGEWRIFSGNEMGVLLAWWVWHAWRAANPTANADNIYMLNSAVSSQIVQTMARIEGFHNDVTLSGFKWMGNLAEKLRSNGKTVLLAWEEAIGFMPGVTLDKDGVLSAAMFAECAAYLAHHHDGANLADQLLTIYKQYGYHLTRNSYFGVTDPQITKKIFHKIRHGTNKYPTTIGKYNVKHVRDLTVGYDSAQPDHKPVLPVSASSEMIIFELDNGSMVALRASGTEPKIKYYIELKTEPGKDAHAADGVQAELGQLEMAVIDQLFEPKLNGLLSRDG